ncbi:MAG: hypothetical protein K2J78_02205 [Muribaculaceae bacterium]|nr:hypothetical protein [Muribaculaceae bacterium]
MKKTVISVKTLGIALLCAFVALIPSLTSCQKDKTANVSDLLSTVPSSAGIVVGFNLNALLEKAGCKVDGSSITPGKELQEILASSESSSRSKEEIKMILSGESGIDPVGAIVFTDAYNTYLTAALADTEKFCDFVVKQKELPFENVEGNVKVSGNVAVIGAQMWMGLTSGTIDAKAVKNYASLDNAQSFASLDVASDIATMTHDVVGYGQLKNFARSGLPIGNATTMNLAAGFLFDNASALSFTLDFLKGEAKSKALLLNDKGDPAKFLLPANKISLDEVKRLPATANAIVAAALTKDLIKKITKMAESFGGGFPAQISDALASLDGTTAIAVGSIDNPENALAAVIATDGKPSLDFMNFLSQFGNTQKDGKIVKLVRGEVSGSLDVPNMSEKRKGATIGLVSSTNSDLLNGNGVGITATAITLSPDNGSLSFNAWVQTSEPDTNALLTILKNMAN